MDVKAVGLVFHILSLSKVEPVIASLLKICIKTLATYHLRRLVKYFTELYIFLVFIHHLFQNGERAVNINEIFEQGSFH